MMDVVIVCAAVLDANADVVTPWACSVPLHFHQNLDDQPDVEALELGCTRGRLSPAEPRPARKRS